MAKITIDLEAKIHAEIISQDLVMPHSPLIIDPITNSYSEFAPLKSYRLSIVGMSGISNPSLLQNGKNSRFTAGGQGYVTIKLFIEDELGNTATAQKKINIG